MLTRAHLQALRPELRALATDACAFANGFNVERTWTSITRGGGGSQTATGQRPDVHMVHLQTAMNADHFPAFNALLARAEALAEAAVLFTDAAGTPAGDHRKFLDDNLAVPFLARYLNRSPYPIDASDERVGYAIDALADAVEATEHRYIEMRPLLNVVLTADEISLGDAMRLRRVGDEEVVDWLNERGIGGYLTEDMALRVFAALERRYILPKGTRQELPPVDTLAIFPGLVGLLADAECRAPMIEHRCIDPDMGLVSRSGGVLPPVYGQRGKLKPDDGPSLQKWAARVTERGKTVPIALALARWQDGTNRTRPEDQLLDYWIGLEALFASDGRGELRFRTSLRIAAYLGKSADERVALYKEMRDSYDARSDLVHGEVPKGNVTALAARTRDSLRRSLIRILDEDALSAPTRSEEDLLRR